MAHAEENLVDEDGLYEELVALAYGVRHVRTLGGAEFFHLPIGAIITQAEIDAAKASNLAASEAEWIQDGKENWAAGRAARWAGHVPTGALGSAHEAAKSAEAYAKNPAATKFKNLPSHHPFNLPTDHPRHVTPPASEAAALALDHQHHMVSGNPDTQFQPHPSSLTGPNEFTVGTEKYNVPAGSRLYQPKGLSNVRIVITPQEGVHAFTHVGEVDVPMDLQQAFADVLPPDAKNNDLYTTKKFDVAAEVSDSLKKSIQDTHDTKAAARYAAALVQNDHAMAQAPQPSGAPPVEPPAPMTAAEAGQHAVVTGALIHAHPGAELVDSSGETQFIKQPDGTWKHALFNATVDEATVQKLVSSGELHIKGAAPGLTHDFKAMSKDQWIAFLDKAPVGAKFQIDGKDIVKGPDKTWNGIASDKMGTLRLVANNYEDGTGPAIPKETPPSAWDQPVGFKESPVPTGPDQIPALQIRTGDKVNGDPVTKTFKTETPGRIRVVTQAADGTIQEHTWLKTTMIGVERADHGPSFDQKFPNASIKKTAEAGAPSPTPANDNLAKPEFQPYMPTSSVDGAKESHDGSGSGSTGGNQPAGGNVESAGSAGLPANDGGNGNAVAGPTGTTAGGVAGLGHPDGNGVGPGVVPPEIIKSELPQSDAIKAMAAKGLVTPQVVELDSQKGAQFFHDAIAALKEGNPYAASVYVHPVDEYKGMRLFLTHDGTSGFALDGNNAVSLFINPTSPHKGGSVAMLTMQTELGAQRLDAFDTKLPGIYAKAGYVPVARVHWNDQYAPEGWDKALYQNYNHGEPDVVFMVHDPAHSDGTYHPGEGKAFASYDQAEAFAKKAALDPSLANPANAAPGDVHHQPGEILSHQDLKNLPPGHTVEHTPSETKYSSQGQGKFLSHKSNAVGDISLMKTAADAGKIAYHSNNEKTAAEVKVAEAAANTAGKSPEPSGSGGQPSETAAAAVPTVEKKSGPSTKKASDLTKGDKIATGTIHLVTTYGAPKGKVTVYYHNNKGILTKAEWNKNTLIGYEAPKAEAPKVEAPKTPTPSTPEAAPAADHAGVQLWEGGPQFSQADVQAAHDALKNAGAFQVSYGFKSIPDNPLASMQAELKAEAKKQFPTMQPKAAVIKLLHNQLSPEQKAESKAEEVAKIHIGAKEPKPTQQGFNGGDYTAEEIQHAIQALEGDNGKLVKSILNKAGSPLGELSPITIPEVGFNKDKTITKQKFIDHLKSLLPAPEGKSTARPEKPVDTLGSIVPPTPEKSGRFKAVPKPEAPKFKARAQNQVDTLGSIIPPTPEKSGRFKAVAKPEALPHEPGTPLTGDQVKALPDGHVIAWHTFDGHSHPDMQHLGVIEGEHVLNDHGTKNSIDTLAAVADTHDPSASTPMKKNGVHYVGGPGTTKFSPSKYLPEANAGHGLYPGDKVTPEAHAKLAPGDKVTLSPASDLTFQLQADGKNFKSTTTGQLYSTQEFHPNVYQGLTYAGHTDLQPSTPEPAATPAVADTVAKEVADSATPAWTPATAEDLNGLAVGSIVRFHSLNGVHYDFALAADGKWHSDQVGIFTTEQLAQGNNAEIIHALMKTAPIGDPKTVEDLKNLPHRAQLSFHDENGVVHDVQKAGSGNFRISGVGMRSPQDLASEVQAGQFQLLYIPKASDKPLTSEQFDQLGVGSRVFYNGGMGRIFEKQQDGSWKTPGGQVANPDSNMVEQGQFFPVQEAHLENPANSALSPELLNAPPNSVVTYSNGDIAKRMAYLWNVHSPDGQSDYTLAPTEVAKDVSEGNAALTFTPTEAQPFAPGKYISNGKAEMHVLPDGTGIYVTSTGTTSKLSPAAVKKNHDAGMSNFLGSTHPVPEVVKKAPSAPGATTKATVPVPTSKDLPNGTYFLKSKNGDVITVIGDQVSKNGEVIGDFKKLKLAFNKGQILDSNGTSITPAGYSGAVTLLNTPTTIPALLDLRQWLDTKPNLFQEHSYWSGTISNLSQAGFPLSISSFVEAFNKNVTNPEDKITGGYYWLQDAATPAHRQAMYDFLSSQIDALLSKVDTAIPEANTSALFDWTTDGYAKPPLQVVSIPQVGGYEAPSTLTAYAKQITEAFGAQKIFNLTHMGKYDKIDWINAVKAGNFSKAYNLEVAAHASKNKAHPSGFLHPGYPGNEATNHIKWAAAVEGEVPAGTPVDGNWSSIGASASLQELDNYLIAAHMQNPEWLTLAEKRQWVANHRSGNKALVDQVSAAAALKSQHGDPQVSPTPVWTDNVQPAKSYDQWFDNGPFPSTNDLYNAGTTAPSDFIHDHPNDPELQKSWDTWTSYYKNNFTSLSDIANGGTWSILRSFISDHFTRLRNEWEVEDAKPKFSVVKEIAAGEHPAYQVSDHKGQQYIFKPVENGKDYRAEIEAAAVQLGALWGFTEPVASVQSLPTKDGGPLFDGKVGLLQSLIPNVGSLNQQEGSVDLSTLTPKQLGQIAAEHVLDWAIDNDDAHNENLLIKPDSTIVGIDKGRAFAAFGHWKGLAANSSMNTQATTVASDLFSKAKSGQLSPEQMDTAYLAAMKAAQKIQKSGDAAATSILEKGLANRPHYTQGPGSKEAVIQAFLDRKHAIVDQVGKMWQGIYDAAGRTKPEPPAKALGEEHQSGWHEKDLSTAVEDKMVWGAATIHSSPDIKHGQSLIWIEKNPNGDTITKGMFSINKYAEKKILSWMDSHLTSDTTSHGVISLADFPNMEPIRKALSTAGREVSDNLVSGVFNQDVMDHFQATKDQLLKDAQFADALPASAGQGTDKIDFPSGISVQPSALGQYRAAIDHYLTAANEVDQAKAEQRQTDKALFSLYHPIATKATPATYINPEKGLAYTELSSGDFITNKGSIVPASQLPDGATEGLNGWMAINGAQQSSGIQVVKEHAGDLAGNLKANGVKEQSNQFSTDGHSGQEYVVHLPTGEYIRFRNSDHTGTDLSQHSQFRFRLAGPDREASLSRVETVLNQMGIDMTGAEEDHAEDIYWREMFYRLVNSNGSGPTSQKDALQELRDLKPALATELGIPSDPYSGGPTISDNNLIDAVSASTTTVPDQHSFWHNLAVKAFGQARVDEFLGAGEHMPQYQHFDIATPEKTTGHAFWNRIDFTLKQILAKKTLIGQGTKGKDKSLANFIKSGNAISTEERLRTLGIFGHGISKTDDQPKGGANSVFTRVAYSGAKYEGSAGFGAHVIYWNPAVALQTGTMAFPSDSFGELAHQNYTPMSVLDALKHGGTDNELDVANAISVLDYMEIMIFNDSGNRNAAIQKFKELGHDILRGVPIEDRLIMRPELDHAMAIVMAAWGN